MKEPAIGSKIELETIKKANSNKDKIPIVTSRELITGFEKDGSFDKWRKEIVERIKESKEIEGIQNKVFDIIKNSSHIKNTNLKSRELFHKLNQEIFNDEKLQHSIKNLITQKLSSNSQLYKDISSDITNSVLNIQKKKDLQNKKEFLSKITNEVKLKKEQNDKDINQVVPQHLKNVVKSSIKDKKKTSIPSKADTAKTTKEEKLSNNTLNKTKSNTKTTLKTKDTNIQKEQKNQQMVINNEDKMKDDSVPQKSEKTDDKKADGDVKTKDDIKNATKKNEKMEDEASEEESSSSSEDSSSSSSDSEKMAAKIKKEDDEFESNVLKNQAKVSKQQKKKIFKRKKQIDFDEQYAELFPESLPKTLTFEKLMEDVSQPNDNESSSEEEEEEEEDSDDEEDEEKSLVDSFSSIRTTSLSKIGRSNVSLVNLFQEGFLKKGDILLFKHRQKEIEGVINEQGEVAAAGLTFNKPSNFAGFVDTHTKPVGHTRHNGWDNVYLKKSDSEIVQLKKIRNQYLGKRKSPKKLKRKRSKYEAHQHYEEVVDATGHGARRKRKR
mmetsp:Transcript_12229/g.18246  ORF Transcript_12229/g.18246 Transcript_12229/m.18246 type:complete len:552 (-) Transcript_12229:28-1683(-)